MAKIKTAAAALKAFGPNGTSPLAGVRLVQKARSSWTVEVLEDNLKWSSMAHFCSAREVIEWANRF